MLVYILTNVFSIHVYMYMYIKCMLMLVYILTNVFSIHVYMYMYIKCMCMLVYILTNVFSIHVYMYMYIKCMCMLVSVFVISSYAAPLSQRASYLALHSSLFGPVAQLII